MTLVRHVFHRLEQSPQRATIPQNLAEHPVAVRSHVFVDRRRLDDPHSAPGSPQHKFAVELTTVEMATGDDVIEGFAVVQLGPVRIGAGETEEELQDSVKSAAQEPSVRFLIIERGISALRAEQQIV